MMMMKSITSGFTIFLVGCLFLFSSYNKGITVTAFTVGGGSSSIITLNKNKQQKQQYHHRTYRLYASSDDNNNDSSSSSNEDAKMTLEEKMKSWEASEAEVKQATLGGIVPGSSTGSDDSDTRERSDAFDVGLYIAFPLMVISGLLFAFFPLIMGNIDTTSVGPPPTL